MSVLRPQADCGGASSRLQQSRARCEQVRMTEAIFFAKTKMGWTERVVNKHAKTAFRRRSMQRPASCRWQKVVLGVGLYTQCGAVSTLDGSIKVPVHNTRRAAIDTGVVAWNAARRRVTSRISHLTPRW
jgi:hypothetical protein